VVRMADGLLRPRRVQGHAALGPNRPEMNDRSSVIPRRESVRLSLERLNGSGGTTTDTGEG
jgi:hypothetical protein